MAKTLDAEDNSFKAEFSKWKKNNKQTLEFFEKCPDTTKAFLFAHADFWYERVNKAWDDAISFSHQQTKLLEEQRELIELLKKYNLTEAVKIVHSLTSISRKDIYQMALKLKDD